MANKTHYAKERVSDYEVKTFCGRYKGWDSILVVIRDDVASFWEHNYDNPHASHPADLVDCKVCKRHDGPSV